MGDRTGIAWTEATWNPITGCSKVSPGCAHCYAETLSLRHGWSKLPWHEANAAENVVLHPERLDQPWRWRKPRLVFVNSMSDLFHEQVPDEFLWKVFAVMAMCQHHTFQVLTKRPERMRSFVQDLVPVSGKLVDRNRKPVAWPLPNVWLGVSVENQHWADVRIPLLLETPAAVRFLSCEPLLGPVSFWYSRYVSEWQGHPKYESPFRGLQGIHWVIAGGESGPRHRPMDPEWATRLRNECVEAGVPFFFKQWGGRTPKAGGRELDGREWSEMPVGAPA